MHRHVERPGVVPEGVLGAVAVVGVPVHDHHPRGGHGFDPHEVVAECQGFDAGEGGPQPVGTLRVAGAGVVSGKRRMALAKHAHGAIPS